MSWLHQSKEGGQVWEGSRACGEQMEPRKGPALIPVLAWDRLEEVGDRGFFPAVSLSAVSRVGPPRVWGGCAVQVIGMSDSKRPGSLGSSLQVLEV